LHNALKTVRPHWNEASFRWKDAVAREFEERYWNALEGGTLATLAALDRLEQVILQVRNDCGRDSDGFANEG
jgi:hypothetical protein